MKIYTEANADFNAVAELMVTGKTDALGESKNLHNTAL
ncbi:MAG: hypothetical protein JWN94_3168 [Betaproteobacteria bacterium]|nr:hypothetical protein [Betaproteobacteria bacterium]